MAPFLDALRSAADSHHFRLLRGRYVRETRRPLVWLAFLLPLVLLHEIAARALGGGRAPGGQVLTHGLIRDVLSFIGLVGDWVPPVVLVVTLLIWHYQRRDRWRVHGWVLGVMVLESVLLAVPLLVVSSLFSPAPPEMAAAGLGVRLTSQLGAGIYEELVFRLLLISGLTWLLQRIAQLPRHWALGTAVLLASVLFSLCHFGPVGRQAFEWHAFWFRTAAGVYLAIVFVGRGLGVASGCHAAYNVVRLLTT